MNNALAAVISLSVSGTILAFMLILVRMLFKRSIPKSALYYLWILVLLRFMAPVSAPVNMTELVFHQAVSGTIGDGSLSPEGITDMTDESVPIVPVRPGEAATASDDTGTGSLIEDTGSSVFAAARMRLLWTPIKNNLWGMWAMGACLSLMWFILTYLRFVRQIKMSWTPPHEEDLTLFNTLRGGRPIRLMCSRYITTPLLMGVVRPCIVIPQLAYTRNGMQSRLSYTLRHELMHHQRRDLLFKWLVVMVSSLHWFNPFMILIRREINRASEMACDEGVIKSLTPRQRKQYAETLLDLAGDQRLPAGIPATTLCEQKSELKERILGIVNYRKRTAAMTSLMIVVALGLTGCASLLGIAANPGQIPADRTNDPAIAVTTSTSGATVQTGEPVPSPTPASVVFPEPLIIPSRTEALQWLPMNPAFGAETFTLPQAAQAEFPVLYAWRYMGNAMEESALAADGEYAAARLWEGRDITRDAGSSSASWTADPIDTEYGPFRETIRVSYRQSRLVYTAMWTLYEQDPFYYGEPTQKTTLELIDAAGEFANSLLGTDEYTQGQPTVYEYEPGTADDGGSVSSIRTLRITWRYGCDGLAVGDDGVTVTLINGRVESLSLKRHIMTREDTPSPQLLLNAEEALYCINYTRSYHSGEDHVFYGSYRLESVTPVLTDVFSDDDAVYTLAWEFRILCDEDEPAEMICYVDAVTGRVFEGSNKGGLFPSPLDS